MNREKPVLGITMGDATGCGPEIIVKSLAEKEFYQTSRLFVIGDAKIMQRAVGIVGSNLKVRKVDSVVGAGEDPGVIDVLDLQKAKVGLLMLLNFVEEFVLLHILQPILFYILIFLISQILLLI